MKMTYHCEVVRRERVKQIVEKIGLGQVVKEKYCHSQDQIVNGQAGQYLCVTDTGITLVKTEDKQTVVTMYVTTYRELVMMYDGEKKIPSYLRKRVDRNQTFFTENGKTIWK